MSRRANPTLIGSFVVGGALLAVALVVFVASLRLFEARERFVCYFDSSVNGLAVGAPVKYRGVPIGQVVDIQIRWNQLPDSTAIPVFFEIDVARIVNRLGVEVDLRDNDVYTAMVEDGLRASMTIGSLITGQLFVELDYVENAPDPVFYQREYIYKEVPTIPSALEEIGEVANNLVANISNLDIGRINDEVVTLLQNANQAVQDLQVRQLRADLQETLAAMLKLAESPRIETLFDDLTLMVKDYRTLANNLDRKAGPVLDNAGEAAQDLRVTLARVREASETLEELLQDDSVLVYRLNDALREVTNAAEALGQLADYIERNPRALISGKALPQE